MPPCRRLAFTALRHDVGSGAARITVHRELYLYLGEAVAHAAFDTLRGNLRGCALRNRMTVPYSTRITTLPGL